MSDVSISEKLAVHIGGISFDMLPKSTIEKVKLCILDQFGAHYAGYRIAPCDAVRGYLSYMNDGPCRQPCGAQGVAPPARKPPSPTATIAHVTVFDDMHAKERRSLRVDGHSRCFGAGRTPEVQRQGTGNCDRMRLRGGHTGRFGHHVAVLRR